MGLFDGLFGESKDDRNWIQRSTGMESDGDFAERLKRNDPYRGKKWVCPRCGTTCTGGVKCRNCGNLNPYC